MTAPTQAGKVKKSSPQSRRNGIQIRQPSPVNQGVIPETVEQFLARGGQVERLGHSAGSGFESRTMREIGEATWKQTYDKKQAERGQ